DAGHQQRRADRVSNKGRRYAFVHGQLVRRLAHLFPKAGSRARSADVRFLRSFSGDSRRTHGSSETPVGTQHTHPGVLREWKCVENHSTFVLSAKNYMMNADFDLAGAGF